MAPVWECQANIPGGSVLQMINGLAEHMLSFMYYVPHPPSDMGHWNLGNRGVGDFDTLQVGEMIFKAAGSDTVVLEFGLFREMTAPPDPAKEHIALFILLDNGYYTNHLRIINQHVLSAFSSIVSLTSDLFLLSKNQSLTNSTSFDVHIYFGGTDRFAPLFSMEGIMDTKLG
ncbi:hypothetical protein KEM48_003623 [Puccinia striiformis f. sp. tritici PST-130]|nr:hypothetical protein KEM48_003623 [Puccinia striiformis f. sp. tritici PST-130]